MSSLAPGRERRSEVGRLSSIGGEYIALSHAASAGVLSPCTGVMYIGRCGLRRKEEESSGSLRSRCRAEMKRARVPSVRCWTTTVRGSFPYCLIRSEPSILDPMVLRAYRFK
jgi:hypothetical protein